MVIGSGPIVIGQAAEFDYAGTQACRALESLGYEVILLNSNPATIQTDPTTAPRVYLEPLDEKAAEEIIRRERPRGLVATLGGQAGLNLAARLHRSGVLQRYGVELLGTGVEAIEKAEDRQLFRQLMEAIGEPIPESKACKTVEEGIAFARKIGLPVAVRPAFTLGGTGGGFAETEEELQDILYRGLRLSPIGEVLVERSLYGWREIEIEVLRDRFGEIQIVCDMENVDPVGIHTGDSIVVAPVQTLTEKERTMLREAAKRIVHALPVVGSCNVQLALPPRGLEGAPAPYYVIEVNPRASRSSALASKATGYPIAYVAALLSVGKPLPQWDGKMDHLAVKVPRWPFDKFPSARRRLGTQMKSTGEVMALEYTFLAALQKAIRSLDMGVDGLDLPEIREWDDETLRDALIHPDDRRIFALAEALRRGMTVEEASRLTAIDPFFVEAIREGVEVERMWARAGGLRARTTPQGAALLRNVPEEEPSLPLEAILRRVKEAGISDRRLARIWGVAPGDVEGMREELGIRPFFGGVKPLSLEGRELPPYLFSTYRPIPEESAEEGEAGERPSVLVLGSGPIRIGQGIEFDYASVHAVKAFQKLGYRTVMVNNNPETVSTDATVADRLYFDPLDVETLLHVCRREKPVGVSVQFGGQTALNLAGPLSKEGIPLLGTTVDALDQAEDRERFEALLESLGIPHPEGGAATSLRRALALAASIGYPVMVRPSYVLGGRAMQVCYGPEDLARYMEEAVAVSRRHPVLVDRYIGGVEVDVDLISDGETVIIPGILEQIERAGIHSGDSMAVYPPQHLSRDLQEKMAAYAAAIARHLPVKGLMNIQMVVQGGEVQVLEVNPRASRTVPILQKATGIPMVELAVRASLGQKLKDLGWVTGLQPEKPWVAVKMPVFSLGKLTDVEAALSAEMKSTGEVMGLGYSYPEALQKAFRAVGWPLSPGGRALLTVSDRDKEELFPIARALLALGFTLLATPGTAAFLRQRGLQVKEVTKLGGKGQDVVEAIREGVDLVINTFTEGGKPERDGFRIRRAAVEAGIPMLTSLDTARAFVAVLSPEPNGGVRALQEYLEGATQR
ncbi:MAG: carbamoyl-phosphate synthase large subunit [Clostridiales bacterium]|nr:carbamoyl-phosphate synthase large subunit [Clostridiales bacterium]